MNGPKYEMTRSLILICVGAIALSLLLPVLGANQVSFQRVPTDWGNAFEGDVAWGDYNNDGFLDALVTGKQAYVVGSASRIFAGNGTGGFRDINATLVPMKWSSVAWGDCDGNGYNDILLTGDSEGAPVSKVYVNNGAGRFIDAPVSLVAVRHSSVAWGDFDADGDLDILLTGEPGSGYVSKVYANDGTCGFSDISASIVDVSYSAVAWGDYNADGKLDILLTGLSASGYVTKIYQGDGLGGFTDIGAALEQVGYSSASWGDYDNDGDPDVLLAGTNASPASIMKIYRQDAVGVFTDIGAPFVAPFGQSAIWGDVEGDNDLDVFISGRLGGDFNYFAEVYRNDGINGFVHLATSIRPTFDGAADWGDYDNDNDLDLLVTGISSPGESIFLYQTLSGPSSGTAIGAHNLLLYRVGDGSVPSANFGAAPAFIDEYTTTGDFVQSILLPVSTSGYDLRLTGNVDWEYGPLGQSPDGRYLVAGGYGTAVGQPVYMPGLKTVGVIPVDSPLSIEATTAQEFISVSPGIETVAFDLGNNIWIGTTGGLFYKALGDAVGMGQQISSQPMRMLRIVQGALYFCSPTYPHFGRFNVSLPRSGNGVGVVALPGLPTNGLDPRSFELLDVDPATPGLDTIYFVQHSGLYKYCLVGGKWIPRGSVVASNLRSLSAKALLTQVVLYIADPANVWVYRDFQGFNKQLSGSFFKIITAASNTFFYGLLRDLNSPAAPDHCAMESWLFTSLLGQRRQLGSTTWAHRTEALDVLAESNCQGILLSPNSTAAFVRSNVSASQSTTTLSCGLRCPYLQAADVVSAEVPTGYVPEALNSLVMEPRARVVLNDTTWNNFGVAFIDGTFCVALLRVGDIC